MDTIGSVFAYFQILIIIIENKLFTKNQFILILSVLLLHVCSVLNYLYDIPNGVKSEKNGLFPDLFKPILLIFLLYNNSISSTGTDERSSSERIAPEVLRGKADIGVPPRGSDGSL